MSQPPIVSEVAWLRERIEREHEAASFALTGPAIGTAQHWFISRRMERIGGYQARLSTLVGEQASMEIVIQVMESSPPQQNEEARMRNQSQQQNLAEACTEVLQRFSWEGRQ